MHVRKCGDACSWGQPEACENEPGWDPLPQAPIGAREAIASVVAGSKWFLWGGVADTGPFDDGAVFDPTSGAWEALPSAMWLDANSDGGQATFRARSQVAIAWTGTDVVMFGGVGANDEVLGDGARWNASSGWMGLSAEGSPSKRRNATAVWADGPGMVIVWGGQSPYGGAASGGGRYRPSADAWQSVATAPIGPRQGHIAVWDPTHGKMIVWGGGGDATSAPERSGAAYDPLTDTWSSIADAPIRRRNAFAFWEPVTAQMVVILGEDGSWPGLRGDGAAYDPSSDSWTLLPELAWKMDFEDPSNLLDWWGAQTRHTWKNETYNRLITEARSILDQTARCKAYNDAERILIEDVGGVFLGYPVWAALHKPWVGGIRRRRDGVRAQYKFLITDAYIKQH